MFTLVTHGRVCQLLLRRILDRHLHGHVACGGQLRLLLPVLRVLRHHLGLHVVVVDYFVYLMVGGIDALNLPQSATQLLDLLLQVDIFMDQTENYILLRLLHTLKMRLLRLRQRRSGHIGLRITVYCRPVVARGLLVQSLITLKQQVFPT